MRLLSFFEKIKRWSIKGGVSVLDQGLYSGANFIFGILLARWLSLEVYGGFSASYSVFLLVSIVQVSLIAEPMSIFGAGKYRENAILYLNYLLRVQWLGSLALSLSCVLIALFIENPMMREAMIGVSISLPFVFLHWFLRRALYIDMHVDTAVITSLIYFILLTFLILLLSFYNHINVISAYLAMALSSLVVSFFTLKRLGVLFWGRWTDAAGLLDSKTINKELWGFGKWILLAYLAGWLTTLSFPLFISILLDTQSAGIFRALQNLFLPFQQFLAAITLLVLPWLSRQQDAHQNSGLFVSAQTAAVLAGLAALVYCSCIIYFRRELLSLLYANDLYLSFDYYVVFLAVSMLLSSSPLILGLALRVLNQPSMLLWPKIGAGIFTVVIGLPVIVFFQTNGVLFALIGGAVVDALILLFFYFRARNVMQSRERQVAETRIV